MWAWFAVAAAAADLEGVTAYAAQRLGAAPGGSAPGGGATRGGPPREPADAAVARGLVRIHTPAQRRELVRRLRQVPARTPRQAMELARSAATFLAAFGDEGSARDSYRRVAAQRPDKPERSLALDLPILLARWDAITRGVADDKLRREARRGAEACEAEALRLGSDQAVREWLARVRDQLG